MPTREHYRQIRLRLGQYHLGSFRKPSTGNYGSAGRDCTLSLLPNIIPSGAELDINRVRIFSRKDV
jgi:hypothetical protein